MVLVGKSNSKRQESVGPVLTRPDNLMEKALAAASPLILDWMLDRWIDRQSDGEANG